MEPKYQCEKDLYATLEFMPLEVRRKLDLCGKKLSLQAWQALSIADRETLCLQQAERPAQQTKYIALVDSVVSKVNQTTTPLKPATMPYEWSTAAAFEKVIRRAASLGLNLSIAQWSTLEDEKKYILHHLSGHERNENKFRDALNEFLSNAP